MKMVTTWKIAALSGLVCASLAGPAVAQDGLLAAPARPSSAGLLSGDGGCIRVKTRPTGSGSLPSVRVWAREGYATSASRTGNARSGSATRGTALAAGQLRELAAIHQSLAQGYCARRQFSSAETAAQRALELLERASGPHSLDLLPPLMTLSRVCDETGRLSEAQALRARCQEIHTAASRTGRLVVPGP